MRLLIVGCGYVGAEVAATAAPGDQVFALTRSPERVSELRELGVQPCVGSWHAPETLRDLPDVDRVLVSVPHRSDQDLGERSHEVGLENLRTAFQSQYAANRWPDVLYLSTTGVYGVGGGQAVDERTPTNPGRTGGKIAVQAEGWLEEHWPAEQMTVLRLAGIYGPGRIPLAEELRAGRPLAVPQSGYLNLVHRRDIARMIHQLLRQRPPQPCYVFSDGNPVARMDFYTHLADLCGVSQPQFTDAPTNDSRRRRAGDKRVDPSRIVRDTEFTYQFPDYRMGLADAVRE